MEMSPKRHLCPTSTNQLPSKDSVSKSSVMPRYLLQNCGFVRVKALQKRSSIDSPVNECVLLNNIPIIEFPPALIQVNVG